jgi:hypothetical protein
MPTLTRTASIGRFVGQRTEDVALPFMTGTGIGITPWIPKSECKNCKSAFCASKLLVISYDSPLSMSGTLMGVRSVTRSSPGPNESKDAYRNSTMFQSESSRTLKMSFANIIDSKSGTNSIATVVPENFLSAAKSRALAPLNDMRRGGNIFWSKRFFSLSLSRSKSQCRSLTSTSLFAQNVVSAVSRMLSNIAPVAKGNQKDASASDISENDHIRIPNWVFVSVIESILVPAAFCARPEFFWQACATSCVAAHPRYSRAMISSPRWSNSARAARPRR